MERILSAGPDDDHIHVPLRHIFKGVLAQSCANALATVRCLHSEDDHLAVAAIWIDHPGHVAEDRSVIGLGDGHVLVGCWLVQRRDLDAVIIGPPAVLMLEDRLPELRPEVVFKEWAERRDRQADQSVQIARMVSTDSHEVPSQKPAWQPVNQYANLSQMSTSEAIYGHDLAVVHHRGFGFHAAACAPGILDILAPVRARRGLVLELGCGTGLLTKELIAAGHRVIATDASPAMLDVARKTIGDAAEQFRQLTVPHDPLPHADAIVAVGHPLNYLPDAGAIDQALIAIAGALLPDGLLALDICDLEWGRARRDTPTFSEVGEDWAIITKFSTPTPDRFIRDITTFLPNPDGTWRRESEHHENVLIDTAQIPALLRQHGVDAQVRTSFGAETNPPGLRVVIGRRP
jgi:SAM-dependent methyltransferase